MKVFIIIAVLVDLIIFSGKLILATPKAAIEQLMEFTFKNAMPQEGPGG